jgi:hypothetical protein
MALTDTSANQVKHKGAPAGEKYSDGSGLHLLVTRSGKYWRLNYRFGGKQKTLALGVYNAVTLANAAVHTFEAVARQWLAKTVADRAPTTQQKVTTWLEHDLFPSLGARPISTISPRDVLTAVQAIEARGALASAHRVKQISGQVFRFAVACGQAERDVTADLKGAAGLTPVSTQNTTSWTMESSKGRLRPSWN